MQTWGEAVRSRRKDLGLSQADAADLAGVGARLVWEVEHDSTSVQLGNLVRLLNALGLHLELHPGAATTVTVR